MGRSKTPSVGRKMGLAAVIMMASVFLSRVTGLVREMVIAYIGGASPAVDAYQVAFIIPEILNHVVASGFLSVTFIPIFSRYLSQDREAEGWEVFSIILTGFGTFLILGILLAMVFAPALVGIVAPGLEDGFVKTNAVRMTRIILPAQFFFFAGGLFMAVQFAKGRFAVPALAPLLYNLGIIAGGGVLGKRLGMEGFSWGVLAGAFFGNFFLQWWGAFRVGLRFSLKIDFCHPDLKKYIALTLPLMVGLTMTFSTEIFFRFFGSFLTTGTIAALNYGLRVMLILVGVFGQAVGVASFPFMARLAVEGRLQEMHRLLDRTLRLISLVIPVSVLCMVLRKEIVVLLFFRGSFNMAALRTTSQALFYLMAGAFAFAAQTIVVRAYYAVQNTLFPAFFGSLAVVLSLPFYWLGMRFMGGNGVALAVSISAVLQAGLLYGILNARRPDRGYRRVYASYARMIGLGAVFGAAFEWMKNAGVPQFSTAPLIQSVLTCLMIGPLYLLAFYGAGRILKIPEIKTLRDFRKSRSTHG
ncbi:MAG: murein biosynthesis integral membrane protein MurJ [Deltaproteobacteria bacterium]|nr:murein biosynthesis integral membrane protein MurJ [Deltaproteobacteria bacterium]